MNDDLHDIDKLFRDGINEHQEPLPPAVWEGVSHSLDQQQAAHFRRKYYKLRRWLLLLLLLCVTSGGYFLIDKLHGGGTKQQAEHDTPTIIRENNRRQENDALKTDNKRADNLTMQGIGKDESVTQPYVAEPTAPKRLKPKDKTESNSQADVQTNSILANAVPNKHKSDEQVKSILTTSVGKKSIVNRKAFIQSDDNFPDALKKPVTVSVKNRMPKKQSSVVKQSDYTPSPQRFYAAVIPAKNHNIVIEPKGLAIAERKDILPPQNTNNKKSKEAASHRLSLGAFVAPNIGFDRMEDNDHLSGPGRNRRDFDKEEDEGSSFSAGVLLAYPLTKKLSLESGLIYTFSSTEIGSKKVYAKADGIGRTRYELQCSSGYSYITSKGTSQPAVGDSATLSSGKASLSYLSVPLAVVYSIDKGKFSLRPSLGFGFNFLLSGKTNASVKYATGTENSTNAISGLKPTYLDGRLGIGMEYKLNNKLSIGLRPTARIALTSINQETPVRSYQNYVSVETGLRIKL